MKMADKTKKYQQNRVMKLKVLSGPNKDEIIQLTDQFLFGRREGDFQVKDRKMSSRHAQVTFSQTGECFLVDCGSTNGIKVNGKRMESLKLTPGITFFLGTTQFQVLNDQEESISNSLSFFDSLVCLKKSPIFEDFCDPKKGLTFFSSPVTVELTREGQKDSFLFAYGPRTIGQHSWEAFLDMPELNEQTLCIKPYEDDGVHVELLSKKTSDTELPSFLLENQKMRKFIFHKPISVSLGKIQVSLAINK